ncbi:MAG: pyruvate dehydrogenase complex dihydrolipoamide acetyltransferase [Leeuwenhoekiella sp.]|uniref:pyruvate dehydrogenase complex dihydrolipoamide acetyltransferase n=1 Tax=unclassified Leeuwenhoekiella TaxID=2615029 RepID=UPI000C35B8F4|nr:MULTISPECIES: pyruvate dehydrogenase complex dihydrolipoamide acetyltransferase [unclassified Leeuwenhoekiella]MAS21255.1 pyruvate dehydrogenase complex dihydrolipoamide acetyltransferase [Leeuwenhoekiella sp.]MAW93895.1 pyruvate dehydrogenase complex dihydrolipoamide acetyltransferase [Leeuwenhoekiella sp.]MBA81691.1 pyruvate dehydrogenase complex dihydrolipoamide acetyltransferase [Leeuwenhoekiella sp.]|tara:strand:+ start:26731 stop:28431 length:1701 start_codon:yes stop_codon:yes gene_type:complete
MAEVINMPRLSDTMEEGTVASWLKKKGDKVEEGDILAEIETDKATMEFESFYEGTLLHIGIQEGETAKVDALLAIIGEEGEDISGLLDGSSDSGSDDEKSEDTEDSEDADENEEESDEASEDSDDDSADEDSSSSEVPEGVEVVTMPRLSDTMEEGTVASWLKKEGDKVEEGDILAEIETDKATMEFESFYKGTLLHIGIQEGETAKVDSLLAIIGPEGTDVSGVISGAKSGSSKKESSKKEEKPKQKEEPKKQEAKKEEPKQKEAPKKEESKSASKNTSSSDGRIFASPLAKKLAEEKGIDLGKVSGSGENGRVVRKDIENYTPAASGGGVQQFVATGEESYEDVNNSQMRKAIAKSLGKSKFTAPHYYLNVEFDMENMIAFRSQFNQLPDTKVSYNDMIIKAVAISLKQHPQVNSQWFDDKMRLNHHVHIGVAVAVPDGLVVPVVEFANEKSLQQINAEVKELAGKARNKKLKPEEMQGSTFTISNLGMFGITNFTSIINQPNSAILSVGAIIEKPVVKNGQIVVGNTMTLSMACDHRTVDGATGAQFLQTLKTYIENPVLMLT